MSSKEQRQLDQALPPELLLLLDAFRAEFDTKLGNLKLWGSLALLGGGTVGGVVSRVAFPVQTASALHSLAHFFS